MMFRGAVCPPFIEALISPYRSLFISRFGGRYAPPSLRHAFGGAAALLLAGFGGRYAPPSLRQSVDNDVSEAFRVSGGGMPPLH